MSDKIKYLKLLAKAYESAEEYDYSQEDDDLEKADLSGLRPDEVASRIIDTIKEL